MREMIVLYDKVAPADIDIVLKMHDDTLRGEGLVHFFSSNLDGLDPAPEARGQYGDRVAFFINAADDLSRIAAIIVEIVGLRADHVLHGQTSMSKVDILGHFHFLQQFEERIPFIPGKMS